MRRFIAVTALGFGLAACSDMPVAPAVRDVAPTTASWMRDDNGIPIAGRYIVRFSDSEQDVDGHANNIASKHAGKITRLYRSAIKGMTLQLSDSAAAALRAEPGVLSVEQDPTMSINTTQSGATWGIDRFDQRTLPLSGTYVCNADGTGVTVYIIDTGINFTHSEYSGRAVTGIDEVTAGGTAADCNGHGSHVSGTVGGTTYGVAKRVKLVAVRVLDCSGSGSTSGVIAGIDWVTAQKNARPSVLSAANMSLGGGSSATLNQAVTNSVAAGVVYAIAAGNSSADTCGFSPASTPTAITVGATDINDGFASFSNCGSCVDLTAPGVNITSSCAALACTFDGRSTSALATATYGWTYGDGATGAGVTSSHTYAAAGTYSVTLTVTDANGTNSKTSTVTVSAAVAPVASFTKSCTSRNCTFNASASTNATSYSWEFGDGTTGTGVKVSHTFGRNKSYTVTLTATGAGGSSSSSKLVTCTRTCS